MLLAARDSGMVASAAPGAGAAVQGDRAGAAALPPPVITSQATLDAMVEWTDPRVMRQSAVRRALEITNPAGLLGFLEHEMQRPAAVLGVLREQRRYADTARLLASLAMRPELLPEDEADGLEGFDDAAHAGAGGGGFRIGRAGGLEDIPPIARRLAMLREAARLASEPSVRAIDAAGARQLDSIRRDASLAAVQADMLDEMDARARGDRGGGAAGRDAMMHLQNDAPALDWLLPLA